MIQKGFEVRYEYLFGRQFNDRLKKMPVGYLPMGTLERHGDHLPMGLDTLKAHGICSYVAQRVGGIVWPPHHYLGIHRKGAERETFLADWGNLYISEVLGEKIFEELLARASEMRFRVMVLYSGHYPGEQIDMIKAAAKCKWPRMKVLAYAEPGLLGNGDHAGLWETSLMAALDAGLVRMDRIGPLNYRQHGWDPAHDPAKASAALGQKALETICKQLGKDIRAALKKVRA